MRPRISTVINYCSNDYPFIKECINHALPFSEQIVVSMSTHFFDGVEENEDILKQTVTENLNASFITFPYIEDATKCAGDWHNMTRAVGWKILKTKSDYILFLDSDEIVDTEKFSSWLENFDITSFDSYRFLGHWYFRNTCYQATQLEEVSVMIKNSLCSFESLKNCLGERLGLVRYPNTKISRSAVDTLHQPMFHHYSWAKTKEQMIRKVKSWGHKSDRAWVSLIEKEFQRDFDENCHDFVHNYFYRKVEPYINVKIA
mgnify:CR=1 FL=1